MSRDLLFRLSEEAIAASCGVGLGEKYNAFVELWANDDHCFVAVRKQYIRMLSSAPSTRALQWKEKIGIIDQDKTNEIELSSADSS
jgi:hypothetical protein